MTAPIRLVNRVLAWLDSIAGWLSAPAMVAAGMLGVISTLIVGATAAVVATTVLG